MTYRSVPSCRCRALLFVGIMSGAPAILGKISPAR